MYKFANRFHASPIARDSATYPSLSREQHRELASCSVHA